MLLDASLEKRIDHVRLDCISRIDETHRLWWVAVAYEDESTKPEGMFAEVEKARELAQALAAAAGVKVVETSFE